MQLKLSVLWMWMWVPMYWCSQNKTHLRWKGTVQTRANTTCNQVENSPTAVELTWKATDWGQQGSKLCLLQPNSCHLWAELRHLLLEKGNSQIWRCRVIADKGRPWPASKTWYLGRKVYLCLLSVIYMCVLVEHIAATPVRDLFPSSFLGGTLTWTWLF